MDNIKVIDSGYHNNRFTRKTSEALYIKQYTPTLNTLVNKPTLNTQEQSIPLKSLIKYVTIDHHGNTIETVRSLVC